MVGCVRSGVVLQICLRAHRMATEDDSIPNELQCAVESDLIDSMQKLFDTDAGLHETQTRRSLFDFATREAMA